MALGHSPQIVTNGMVLCLDAANPKNYNLTEVEVLVVAGGGGGGGGHGGGGGGAGGLIYNRNFTVTPGSALTVTVGGGGNGGNAGTPGSDGSNSVFGALTATGGGGGGGENSPQSGRTGGSGGGGSGFATASSGGAATSGQGFGGGGGGTPDTLGGSTYGHGGGGGGAGGAGTDGTEAVQPSGNVGTAGVGGSGLGVNISGTFTYYAGGGGGGYWGSNLNGGAGGLGGGGRGGDGHYAGTTDAVSGTSNTGGGGGGSPGTRFDSSRTGGNGGSGIVIVRYPGPQKAIGGTVTSVAGHTIHTFTTVGSTTFTPLVATNNSAILGLSDFSGNNNSGVTYNSPTYLSTNNGSISFDGTNDYLQANVNTTSLDGDPSLTVDMFVRRRTGTNIGPSAGFWGIGGSGQGNSIQGWTPTTNLIHLDVYDSTRLATSQYYPEGQFVHIVWTKSGAGTETTNVKCYINGVEASLTKNRNATRTNQLNTSTNGVGICLGRIVADEANYHAPVDIGSFKIYNRALTAAEISQNFNALRSRYGI